MINLEYTIQIIPSTLPGFDFKTVKMNYNLPGSSVSSGDGGQDIGEYLLSQLLSPFKQKSIS